MLQNIFSFGLGVYVGTYFDCKPIIQKFNKFVKENFPKEK